jgi:CheY-like chemotaxis protein
MRVVDAADGRIGLEAASRQLPDVILLGVMMPAVDGWTVADAAGADGPAALR